MAIVLVGILLASCTETACCLVMMFVVDVAYTAALNWMGTSLSIHLARNNLQWHVSISRVFVNHYAYFTNLLN